MNLKKNILLIVIVSLVFTAYSKNYYIRQMLIASAYGDGKMDTTYQETYISDDIIVITDAVSRSYIKDGSYQFYNMSDSSYFNKSFKELEELMSSADTQLKDFDIKKTDEKKKIGQWQTEKYSAGAKIMDMDMDIDMFVAKDTGFPVDLMVRQQDKMYSKSVNIKNMTDKIKATGGIVVREVAKIGGVVVSEKEIVEMKILDKIDKKYSDKPEGFKEMKK